MFHAFELMKSRQCRLAMYGAAGTTFAFWIYKKIWQPSRLSPRGKAIFISGCDSGFGQAAADKLRELGYVVFAGYLNAKQAVKRQEGDNYYVLQLDVTNQQQIDAAIDKVKAWLADHPNYQLYGIVNNAGISSFGPLECVQMETFEKTMDINFHGSVRICKAFLPLMRFKQPTSGRIVFMGSVGGTLPCPYTSQYGCTKAAILFLADTLALELDRFNIAVSVILPDFYKTNIMVPEQSLATFDREVSTANKSTIEEYGGNAFLDRLRRFITVISPPRAKSDLSPVIDSIVHAINAQNPRRYYYPIELSTKIANFIHEYAPGLYFKLMKDFI